jgi:hypothetical protein
MCFFKDFNAANINFFKLMRFELSRNCQKNYSQVEISLGTKLDIFDLEIKSCYNNNYFQMGIIFLNFYYLLHEHFA